MKYYLTLLSLSLWICLGEAAVGWWAGTLPSHYVNTTLKFPRHGDLMNAFLMDKMLTQQKEVK